MSISSQYTFYPTLTPVRVAAATNVIGTYFNGPSNSGVGATITPPAATTLTISGVVVNDGDRVLLPVQTNTNERGIYVVSGNGVQIVLTRSNDFHCIEQLKTGLQVATGAGTSFAGAMFVLIEPLPARFGIDPITFIVDATAGSLGTAALKNVTDDSQPLVASINGATVINHLLVAADTAGTVKNADGVTAIGGNIQAGLSGTAGTVASYPSAAASGHMVLAAVNCGGGDFTSTISNSASLAQNTVYTVGNVGTTTQGIVASTAVLAMKSVVKAAAAGGSATQNFVDAFCTTSSSVVGNWVTQANAASVLTINPGAGSFDVVSTADAGVGTFSYTILK